MSSEKVILKVVESNYLYQKGISDSIHRDKTMSFAEGFDLGVQMIWKNIFFKLDLPSLELSRDAGTEFPVAMLVTILEIQSWKGSIMYYHT